MDNWLKYPAAVECGRNANVTRLKQFNLIHQYYYYYCYYKKNDCNSFIVFNVLL